MTQDAAIYWTVLVGLLSVCAFELYIHRNDHDDDDHSA